MRLRTLLMALILSFPAFPSIAQSKGTISKKEVPGALILIDGMRIRRPFRKPIPIQDKFAIEEAVREYAGRYSTFVLEQSPSNSQEAEELALWMNRGQRIKDAVSVSGCVLKDDPQGYCIVVVPSIESNVAKPQTSSLLCSPETSTGSVTEGSFCNCTNWMLYRSCTGSCTPVGWRHCCRTTDCPVGCQGHLAICGGGHSCPDQESCPDILCTP
jgi:hypothetical protein